jgi:hypothetical protein
MAPRPAPPGGGAPAGPSSDGSHDDRLFEVAAYAMNALSADESAAVQAHIADCDECQQELAQMREVAAGLGEVPKQAFLEGPPENAELLIQGTLRRIRAQGGASAAESITLVEPVKTAGTDQPLSIAPSSAPVRPARSAGRFRYRDLAVAAAAIVIAVGAGSVIGRSTAPARTVAITTPAPSATATAAVVPGTLQATSTDPKTGARLTAQVVPVSGWVRVTAAASGIKAGQRCTLYVVSRSGQRVQAGSWLVSDTGAAQGTTLQGSALVTPGDVAALEIQNSAGDVLVRTEV